jgi:hypothetical protein
MPLKIIADLQHSTCCNMHPKCAELAPFFHGRPSSGDLHKKIEAKKESIRDLEKKIEAMEDLKKQEKKTLTALLSSKDTVITHTRSSYSADGYEYSSYRYYGYEYDRLGGFH